MNLLAKLAQNVLILPANEVWGKVIFLHLFVILFTVGGLPQCMLGYHPHPPGTRHPPRTRHTPWDHAPLQNQTHTPPPHPPGNRHSPRTRHTPPQDQGDMVNARAIHIPLECNLVFTVIPSETVLAPSRRTGRESKKHQAHLFVILFTVGGLPQCMLGYHPHPLGPGTHPPQGPGTPPRTRHTPLDHAPLWDQTHTPHPIPLGRDTPRDQAHTPQDQGDMVNARPVRIPLECNLVFTVIPSETVLAPSRRTGRESKKHQAHQLWHTRLKSISPLKCTEE